MPPTNFETDSQALLDAMERLSGVSVLAVTDPREGQDGAQLPYVVLPSGKTIANLKPIIDAFRTKPERRQGTVTIATAESFVDIVNRYASDDTVVFADRGGESPSLLAIFDYHPAGPGVERAAFGRHRARYVFPLSEEWQEWRERDGNEFDGQGFARFLEDRIQDVQAVDPEAGSDLAKLADLVGGSFASPSQLLELSRSLSINATVAVHQAQTLSSGEINVAFSEVHSDGEGRPIKVPNLFVVGIPVFRDGAKYRMACRLRYRLTGGRIIWWYTMVNPDLYFDDAVIEVCHQVEQETARPLLYGTPES